MVAINVLFQQTQYIHVDVPVYSLNFAFSFTAIYGLHTIDDRKTLWTDLKDPNNLQQGPWVLIMLYYMQMKE